ncbi:type II toxin-antitoxin system RelE/ParE family toxin [Sulfurimonas sp.]|uniref:type II toxin-antitoxin system RelE/ParE family toxin n=1 Tax=Sulfurimonas sp. TaxID=2022749 RepID=UPI003D103CF3
MNLEFLPAFVNRLEGFVEIIADDKPSAARKFHKEIINACREIQNFPYKHRKSMYFDDEDIRDLVHKGFVIIYKIEVDTIRVFAFINRNAFSNRTDL